MQEDTYISKNRTLTDSQDYTTLRQKGLDYIQQFAHNIWTDYNVHDPGITILEALCYALTDLGYRSNFSIEDILTRPNDDVTKDFFTAREILTCNPVTFFDYRKLFIDIEGIQNAWVKKYDQPAFYHKCDLATKNTTILPYNTAIPPADYTPDLLNGLYQFQLLLEEDPVLDDININVVDWELRDNNNVRIALVRTMFPLTVEKYYPYVNTNSIQDKLETFTGIQDYDIVLTVDGSTVTAVLTLYFDAADKVNPDKQLILNDVRFRIQLVNNTDLVSVIQQFENVLNPPAGPDQTNKKKANIEKIFNSFHQKVRKACTLIDQVYCTYQQHRNLDEDVMHIKMADTEELAICTDIEVQPDADLEDIQGQIYFLLDTFLAPEVTFYTLQEMYAKGFITENIFNGEWLSHGFISDAELIKAELKTEIHVSDLYNIIMGIPGVKTVKNLQVTNYLNGVAQTSGEPWKLILGGSYHVEFDRLRSKIVFYKELIPLYADKQVTDRIYADLKASAAKPLVTDTLQAANDLPVIKGEYYQLDEYYSIQNEFPRVYGIGKNGAPAEANDTAKAQIKQLKAYLLFFDQLLANYVSQLQNLKGLYSLSNNTPQTYFFQPVYDRDVETDNGNFPQVMPLFRDFSQFSKNIDPVTLQTLNPTPDDYEFYKASWKSFVEKDQPANLNAYLQNLQNIVEPEQLQWERRNRLLDHLIARFAEQFSDYAMMMYRYTGNVIESANKKTAQEIAEDKFRFLSDYPRLSHNRGKAMQYKACKGAPALLPWDNNNISGLQERGARLLGIDNPGNFPLVWQLFEVVKSAGNWIFRIQKGLHKKLTSKNNYADEASAWKALDTMVYYVAANDPINGRNYINVVANGTKWKLEVTNGTLQLAVSPLYTSQQDALDDRDLILQYCTQETMHIFEHLLLRPLPLPTETITQQDMDEGYFPLCQIFNPDCKCAVNDYYSFRISVILPYWSMRFRDMGFRKYAEDLLHQETPAHILPKFCWVSLRDMNRLEQAYEAWFNINQQPTPDYTLLNTTLKALIKVLNTLTTIYPVGHLHDCSNPGQEDVVILDNSILGTFNETNDE